MSSVSSPDPTPNLGRSKIARNLGAGGAVSLAKVGIQILLLPIMAHLLGPAEFGLYALALPVVSFFNVVSDGGLGISLARESEGEALVWSTAFWAVLAIGVTIAILVTLWGFIFAGLAHQSGLFTILSILSISFLFIALSVLPAARLTRRGDLVTLAKCDFLSTILGAITAVACAYAGMGAVSLALQYVVVSGVRALMMNLAAFEPPQRQFKLSAIRHHLTSGGYLISGRLVDFACRFTETLLFGRFFGPVGLGTYTFGNQVPRFVTEAVSNPTWSVLYAQAVHETPVMLASLYRKLSRVMALATFPTTFLLAASAPQVIDFVLGPKWDGAAIFIQILAPSYAISAIGSLATAVFLSNGRNRMFLATFILAGVGRVLGVCLGLWVGMVGVAWAIALSNVIVAGLSFYLCARLMAEGPFALVHELAPPALASLVGAILCYGALDLQTPTLVGTLASISLGGIGFLVTLFAIEGATLKADLLALWRMIFSAPTAD